jgi:hypothetical protein
MTGARTGWAKTMVSVKLQSVKMNNAKRKNATLPTFTARHNNNNIIISREGRAKRRETWCTLGFID